MREQRVVTDELLVSMEAALRNLASELAIATKNEQERKRVHGKVMHIMELVAELKKRHVGTVALEEE